MSQRNVLWLSQHDLQGPQKILLRSLHGKKITIEKRDIRFTGFCQFIKFLNANDDKFIYCVIPRKWRIAAQNMGHNFGHIYRPYNFISGRGKRRRRFTVQFFKGDQVVCKRTKELPCRGNKGYINRAYC